jgi:hypothetical protein
LLVTGADEEVPTGQLFLEGTNRVGDVDRALRLLVVTGEHERLEMERVIEVEDHDLARNAELGNVVKEIALHDGDVTPTLELLEPRPVCGLHRELPRCHVTEIRRGGEHHLVRRGQSLGDVPGPDGGPGHLRRKDVIGDDHDAPRARRRSIRRRRSGDYHRPDGRSVTARISHRVMVRA